jgi:rhamnosyltransferase
MFSSNCDRVCAIVVTYHPGLDKLKKLLDSAIPQVAALVVVDNGSDEKELSSIRNWATNGKLPSFSLLELGDNLGIAAAQNRGIAWAQKQSFSHVLFFDQDSLPAISLVASLMEALNELQRCKILVAAIGPRLVDLRSGKKTPFVTFNWYGVTKKQCSDSAEQIQSTDFLVSSGMLVAMNILDRVGLMNEDLFIDNVDMEWSFRARSLGYQLFGVCGAFMQHSVGDQVIKLGTLEMYRHSPIRQYYIMRNRLYLYRIKYSPMPWIIQDTIRAIFKTLVFSLVFSPRRKNISMMYRGAKDACMGKLGRFHE